MTICQLQNKSISLLFVFFSSFYLFGCAETPVEPPKATVKKTIQPNWFKLPQRFATFDQNENFAVHPFYDVDWKPEDYEDWGTGKSFKLPFVATTPVDSDAQYDFDILTGKIFRKRMFCPSEDVWGTYTSTLNRPNFTQGFIPRVQDRMAKPQRAIIFSSPNFRPAFSKNITSYSDVKIVGSVITEDCETYPCDTKDKWIESQILIGVTYEDEDFKKIETFQALKNRIDWNYSRAMIANMNGNHFLGGRYAPATRVLRELSKAESRDYFTKSARRIDANNMSVLIASRENCFVLYDKLWDESEKIRKEKQDQSQKFFTFFKDFYTKNSAELYGCQNFVRPANILDNSRRFWFFTYIQAFTMLEKAGVVFNCRDTSWSVHAKLNLEACRANTFEKSFEQVLNGLRLMKTQLGEQYQFVEYDTLTGGSHQPIYSWLYRGQRSFQCNGSNVAVDPSNFDIFPQDVAWESFESSQSKIVR